MVFVNQSYNAVIHGRNLRTSWYGTITLKSGSSLPFDMSNINDASGELTMRCSSDSAIDLGGGYAAELRMGLKNLYIDRYLLIDAVIGLYAAYIQNIQYETWEDVGGYTFDQIGDYTWFDIDADIYYRVPMGLYTIKEAMRTADCIKITAYDNMIKLDKDLPVSFTEANRTPYQWLALIGTDCGIEVGMTKQEVRRLPNGNRALDFANVNTEVKTYRDMVIQLAMACGAVAVIGRDGKLKLRTYNLDVADEVGASFRYSSEFSDYQVYYTGLYATYQDEGLTEYFRNTTEQQDTGLAIDLGVNSFMQITTESKRKAAAQAIINIMKNLQYVPFNVNMPFNPAYEPMDILKFYDNQAQREDITPITKIAFRINDKMAITCGGANPAITEFITRQSKAIERASSDSYASDLFWMVMDNAPPENAVVISAKNTPTKIGEVLFYASKNKSMLSIAYTATFMLNITTLVRVKIYVDDELIYATQENLWPNENRLTATTGYELDGKGSHSVSVYLEIDDSTLDVGGGGVLMAKSVDTNGLYVAADDGVYGYSQVTALIDDAQGYYAGAQKIEVSTEDDMSSYNGNELSYATSVEKVENVPITEYYCRLSTHVGDGASFNGRHFVRTSSDHPLLFINLYSTNGYSSYGVISNIDEVPPNTHNGYGELASGGTLTVNGNTFYVFRMGGMWAMSRSGIQYVVNGEPCTFQGDACFLVTDFTTVTINALSEAFRNDFYRVLDEFAAMEAPEEEGE